MIMIYEDKVEGEAVYFDDNGDLICESASAAEGGESCNVLDEEAQRTLYEELRKKFCTSQ